MNLGRLGAFGQKFKCISWLRLASQRWLGALLWGAEGLLLLLFLGFLEALGAHEVGVVSAEEGLAVVAEDSVRVVVL